MKKAITGAEIVAAGGFSLVIYGVGRMHLESAIVLAGIVLCALGFAMATRKSQ